MPKVYMRSCEQEGDLQTSRHQFPREAFTSDSFELNVRCHITLTSQSLISLKNPPRLELSGGFCHFKYDGIDWKISKKCVFTGTKDIILT